MWSNQASASTENNIPALEFSWPVGIEVQVGADAAGRARETPGSTDWEAADQLVLEPNHPMQLHPGVLLVSGMIGGIVR